MSKNYNEKTRVQIPAMLHLARLGYIYAGKMYEENAGEAFDSSTNILIDQFHHAFNRLNPGKEKKWLSVFDDIKKELNDDDLGKQFYERLTSLSPYKLIDFEEPLNNDYHYTAEFTCKNGEDEFRPDITLFINGLPLVFIEVKKTNNFGGMVAEADRMTFARFPNKKFRRFINITQLMIFSNNMEYSSKNGITPIEGAFYCTGSRKKAFFNCFREDNFSSQPIPPFNEQYPYEPIDPQIEKQILTDFNCQVIKQSPEYQTNLDIYTPTNRIITSMCSPERLLFILKYGIAYVKSEREVEGKIESTDEKHIMRYQQMFAALSIREALTKGKKSGIVWHTQGSGKTALSYYLTKILTDYYADQKKVTKFYFIVDRLDLLEQAKQEFEARGLTINTANSKSELMQQFRNNQSQEGSSGKAEITVVNIQKVEEDHDKIAVKDYATNLQRIFIIDEAHRGYKPDGCFLANLFNADKDAVKIALTGTPILKEERSSCSVFGEYFHAYYYDKSISDGYTLKILREEIETSYRKRLTEAYQSLEKLVTKGELKKEAIISHDSYVKELLRYIIKDLLTFRALQGDPTLGGMIICETSEQARKLFQYFDEIQTELRAAPENGSLGKATSLKPGLILYDSDDKEIRKQIVKDFKKNFTIDLLIVYNMLLTGFDAPRLKRLYFGRKLREHGLLQAITRVNRPYSSEYGEQRYGTVIDFADIKANFDEINNKYIKEFQKFSSEEETGVENLPDMFNQVLEQKEEIIKQMKEARQILSSYDITNAEIFDRQITESEDKKTLFELRTALMNAKNMFNLVRTFGDEELKETFSKLVIEKLPDMLIAVQSRINELNTLEAFETSDETKMLINETMMNIQFNFSMINKEELKLVDNGAELQEKLNKTLQELRDYYDHEDPEYITLAEAFRLRFKQHKFKPENIAQYNEKKAAMDEIYKRIRTLRRKDDALLSRYHGDKKFVRVHKRIVEENTKRKERQAQPIISTMTDDIVEAMMTVKQIIDQQVYDRNDILKKDAYFAETVWALVDECLYKLNIKSEAEDCDFIQSKVSKQYLNQYHDYYTA
ncbi:MAG: type I restriction endonuclease subunit R [Spirochaetaceae bacterium]|nr:type I restriction endonuclease subunit R [Spirochaetaceae bacterium]